MARLLNFAQSDRIVTVLRFLAHDLLQAHDALDGPRQAALLIRTRLNAPDERRAATTAEIEAALCEIAGLARDLDLPVREQDVTGNLIAALRVDCSDLANLTSGMLGRYGALDPGLAAVLDERIERLSERTLAIAQLIRGDWVE